ncbi:MAG: RNA polymerase sigma factor [Ignavibacteriaceae bacterium]|nr:RNA polymerase sigma factor [Ignavibacteriaceae bacterium]
MTSNKEDFQLINDFLAGDENSFNKIVLKYQKQIYWHARRMTGNHLDADEVVQEVLLTMYKKIRDFKFKSSLYTWIYRITSTRSINFLRRKSLRNFFSTNDDEAQELKSGNDIIIDLEVREQVVAIEKLLQKIPARQREVFIMRHYDELTYEEISKILGKSVGGLKANYFNAVKKLSEMVKNEKN